MRIYAERARESSSTMSYGLFRAAALESAAKAGVPPPDDSRTL
jgi:hypothetical protein